MKNDITYVSIADVYGADATREKLAAYAPEGYELGEFRIVRPTENYLRVQKGISPSTALVGNDIPKGPRLILEPKKLTWKKYTIGDVFVWAVLAEGFSDVYGGSMTVFRNGHGREIARQYGRASSWHIAEEVPYT